MSGVWASSMKMLSASSTMAKCSAALDARVERRGRPPGIHGGPERGGRRLPAAELQPVAEEVEAELGRGAVGDVAAGTPRSRSASSIFCWRHADRQAEHLVDRPDPLGVALGQVVVDGGDVDAFPDERLRNTGNDAVSVLPSPVASSTSAPECMTHAGRELHVEGADAERPLDGDGAEAERLRR